jgi:hypothetical protein
VERKIGPVSVSNRIHGRRDAGATLEGDLAYTPWCQFCLVFGKAQKTLGKASGSSAQRWISVSKAGATGKPSPRY